MWDKIIANINTSSNIWKGRTTAIKDHVLLAKTMLLSKLWYVASILPVPVTVIKRIDKVIFDFVWNSAPHKVGKKQMRRDKDNNGLDLWDLDAKIQSLQAGWILKFVNNKIKGSLFELITDKCIRWAEAGTLRHLLNDPDDNREFIDTAPLAEIIFSWSKIVKPEPNLTPDTWCAEIIRTSSKRKKIIEEKLSGLLLVKSVNYQDGTALMVEHRWANGLIIRG